MSADLAVLLDDPAAIERAADPATFIIQACERAKAWLREVLDHGDIDQIAELKSQAEAIRVYTMQKQLGKDAQLSAAEVVRRAERGIGVAIRRGQEAGEINKRRQHQGNQHTAGLQVNNRETNRRRPVTDFVSYDDLRGNGAGIYDLTDGVSDDDFEAGIAVARAEGNLSRANVVRKVTGSGNGSGISPAERRARIAGMAAEGCTSRQIAAQVGVTEEYVRQLAREDGIGIRADKVTEQVNTNRSGKRLPSWWKATAGAGS